MGLFFWTPHYTPPSPTHDMELFPQMHPKFGHKRAFMPLLAVKFGALAGYGTRAERLSVSGALRGRDEHWHHEHTLRKGLAWPDRPLAQ